MSEIAELLQETSKKRTIYSFKLRDGSRVSLGEFLFGDEEPIKTIIAECMANPIKSKRISLETPEIRESKQIQLMDIESNFPWKKTPEHLRKNILLHISDDEKPLFIISSEAGGAAGSLVCMKDRCILIKSGFWGGFMADSFGGARVASFYYSDITGIEYNSGILNGVLEILTASYQGTTNKDYWKSGSKNEDSNDPWDLSNTLPLGKADYESAKKLFDKLRKLISQAKPTATLTQDPSSIADEISKLASQLKDGLIDESEFKKAKKRLLG
jgi:hypothetical protein